MWKCATGWVDEIQFSSYVSDDVDHLNNVSSTSYYSAFESPTLQRQELPK